MRRKNTDCCTSLFATLELGTLTLLNTILQILWKLSFQILFLGGKSATVEQTTIQLGSKFKNIEQVVFFLDLSKCPFFRGILDTCVFCSINVDVNILFSSSSSGFCWWFGAEFICIWGPKGVGVIASGQTNLPSFVRCNSIHKHAQMVIMSAHLLFVLFSPIHKIHKYWKTKKMSK